MLDGMEFGSIFFCSAKPMNVLTVLLGEFDTQLLTISSGVEIPKKTKLCSDVNSERYLKVCVVGPEVKDVG